MYFCDYFGVSEETLDEYGAFNISLMTDLPLFIDPFLLFNSEKSLYQKLHSEIIRYLRFLRDKSVSGQLNDGLINAWYRFPEVHENWLGFSETDNKGRGLGRDFADALNKNLSVMFTDFGKEQITKGSHLEKLCLVKDGVGRDNISDFTTNLIKGFLLEYTQTFATEHIEDEKTKDFPVRRVLFNYETETWVTKTFKLPAFGDSYVLLTPKDILTRDTTWINKDDLVRDFDRIPEAIPDQELRAQINSYFRRVLPADAKRSDKAAAVGGVISQFPQFLDYYIKYKELNGDRAESISAEKVEKSEQLFIENAKLLRSQLGSSTAFYELDEGSYQAALQRVGFLKQVIENNDGYRFFWTTTEPIAREKDLQLLYRLTWFRSPFDVNQEVNNGRGPVDYKISNGKRDSSLVEFKLASNKSLKKNLKNQVEIYEAANETKNSIKVILYFTEEEYERVFNILKELKLESKENVVLIDGRRDNKPSASKADHH